MQIPRLNSAIVGILVLALAVPTGAVMTGSGGSDDVRGSNGIVLEPAPGANGEYAEIGPDTNLSIDISDPGINLNATTRIDSIFRIKNTGNTETRVWLTHNGTEEVTLTDSTRATPLESERNSRVLGSGEQLLAGIRVDTTNGSLNAGDTVLESIQLHTETLEDEEETATTTPTPTEPTPQPDENESVRVDFGPNVTSVNVSTTELSPDEVPEPTDTGEEGPTAVINTEDDLEEQSSAGEPGIRVNNTTVNTVTNVGETVELEGDQSLLDSSDSIDVERRIAKAVDIRVPPELERRSATVQIRVARNKLGDTTPENARIGHRTEQGWQLLNTKVVDSRPDSVVLEARTPHFSPFAVFRSPDVSYEWTLPDGTTHSGPEVRSEFDESGFYNLRLAVTDAYGRTNTTKHRILVNDIPEVEIDGPGTVAENESVTVRANLTNRFGNTTITWQLPDGKQASGNEITTSLSQGVHTVEVHVRNEFGATATATHTVYVGVTPGESTLPSFITGSESHLLALLGLFVVIIGWIIVLRRIHSEIDGLPRPGTVVPWRRSRKPRITAFKNPHWETTRGRFKIETLQVRDPDNDLRTVEISITHPDGRELARKTIDLGQTDQYQAEPAVIQGITIDDVAPDIQYVARVRAVDQDDNERFAREAVRLVIPRPHFGAKAEYGV